MNGFVTALIFVLARVVVRMGLMLVGGSFCVTSEILRGRHWGESSKDFLRSGLAPKYVWELGTRHNFFSKEFVTIWI